MTAPVLKFELTAKDVKRIQKFYKTVFGWSFGKGPHDGVHSIDTGTSKGVKGYLLERGEHIPDYVSFYVGVPDLKRALSKIKKAGGTILRPPFKPNGNLELAIVTDPEGHVLTLMKSK